MQISRYHTLCSIKHKHKDHQVASWQAPHFCKLAWDWSGRKMASSVRHPSFSWPAGHPHDPYKMARARPRSQRVWPRQSLSRSSCRLGCLWWRPSSCSSAGWDTFHRSCRGGSWPDFPHLPFQSENKNKNDAERLIRCLWKSWLNRTLRFITQGWFKSRPIPRQAWCTEGRGLC